MNLKPALVYFNFACLLNLLKFACADTRGTLSPILNVATNLYRSELERVPSREGYQIRLEGKWDKAKLRRDANVDRFELDIWSLFDNTPLHGMDNVKQVLLRLSLVKNLMGKDILILKYFDERSNSPADTQHVVQFKEDETQTIQIVFRGGKKFAIYFNYKFLQDYETKWDTNTAKKLAYRFPAFAVIKCEHGAMGSTLIFSPPSYLPRLRYGQGLHVAGWVDSSTDMEVVVWIRDNLFMVKVIKTIDKTQKVDQTSQIYRFYRDDPTPKAISIWILFRKAEMELYIDRDLKHKFKYNNLQPSDVGKITVRGKFLLDEALIKNVPHKGRINNGFDPGNMLTIRGFAPMNSGITFELRNEWGSETSFSSPLWLETNPELGRIAVNRRLERSEGWETPKEFRATLSCCASYTLRIVRTFTAYQIFINESSVFIMDVLANEPEPNTFKINSLFLIEDIRAERLEALDLIYRKYTTTFLTACTCVSGPPCSITTIEEQPPPGAEICRCIVGSSTYECFPKSEWATGECKLRRDSRDGVKLEEWQLINKRHFYSTDPVDDINTRPPLNGSRACICHELWHPKNVEHSEHLRNYKCVPYDNKDFNAWENLHGYVLARQLRFQTLD